jgi:hypothetical protein
MVAIIQKNMVGNVCMDEYYVWMQRMRSEEWEREVLRDGVYVCVFES